MRTAGIFVFALSFVFIPSRGVAGDLLQQNPYGGDEKASRAGAKLYKQECASCHGQNRQGLEKAPPLNVAGVAKASPGALFRILTNGSLKRGMPSFAHLPEARRWQLIAYLQSDSVAS